MAMDERWARALAAKGVGVGSVSGAGRGGAASHASGLGASKKGVGAPRAARTGRPFKSTGRKGGISRQSG